MTHSAPSSTPISRTTPSPRLLRAGLASSFLLMLIALGVFALSLQAVQPPRAEGFIVNVTAGGCQPEQLEVPAGQRTFTIINRSDRAIEWEIIDGVMVLAERENIAPGLRQPLTASLTPGDYAMTCGLLSNPRGTLHVAPNGDTSQPKALVARDFIGPLAEYRVYTLLQLRQLTSQVRALHDAIYADDLHTARAAYLEARRIDQRLATPIGLFSDLDQRMNAHADYFAQRESDPDFGGFPRVALSLFERGITTDLKPTIDRLVEDVETLKTRLEDAAIPPAQLANGSARVLQAWHDRQVSQATLSPCDLFDLAGLTEGAGKIVSLLAPLLERQAPGTLPPLNDDLATLQQDLASANADNISGSDDSRGNDASGGPLARVESDDGIDAKRLLQDSEALAKSLSAINRALALSG